MAQQEKKRTWSTVETWINRALNIRSVWLLFPHNWRAAIVAASLGAIAFIFAALKHANLAKAWLYFVGVVVLYAVGWALIQLFNRIGGRPQIFMLPFRVPSLTDTNDRIFRLENCGSHAATFVTLGPLISSSGKWQLHFVQEAILKPGSPVALRLKGMGSNPRDGSSRSNIGADISRLKMFFEENDESTLPVRREFRTPLTFRDRDGRRVFSETIVLDYDRVSGAVTPRPPNTSTSAAH